MGYKAAKAEVLADLLAGTSQHEIRDSIDEKNKLLTGEITAAEVITLIKRSSGSDDSCSPHHRDKSISVHVIRQERWYIKFYFLNPGTMFISVHE